MVLSYIMAGVRRGAGKAVIAGLLIAISSPDGMIVTSINAVRTAQMFILIIPMMVLAVLLTNLVEMIERCIAPGRWSWSTMTAPEPMMGVVQEAAGPAMSSGADACLWDTAQRLYAISGVAEHCLEQQDHGADVPVLLCAAWLGRRGVALSAEAAAELGAAVTPWQSSVVMVLRTLRRTLKSGPSPAPSMETDVLREQVKTCELEAERIQLLCLERLTAGWPASGATAFANLHVLLGDCPASRALAKAAQCDA